MLEVMSRPLLLLATLVLLTGCKKDTVPTVTNDELGRSFVQNLKDHPKAHCVRTSMLGFIEDGATWLIHASGSNYASQEVAADFQNKLLTLEDKRWLRVQRYNNAEVGEYWKVYYTPEARRRFGIDGNGPVRKDQVQRLCFGPQKATYLEKEGPVELVNGVPRVMVKYRVRAAAVPEWAKDPELGDLVWQRPPDNEVAGVVRMYLGDKGTWQVDPTFNTDPAAQP